MREFDQDLKDRQAFFVPFTAGSLRRAMQLAKAERVAAALEFGVERTVTETETLITVKDAEGNGLLTDTWYPGVAVPDDATADDVDRFVLAQFYYRVLAKRGTL